MTADYRSILEGICPHCDQTLERANDYGWCDECEIGWSYRDDTVTMILRPSTLPLVSEHAFGINGVGASRYRVAFDRTRPT